MPTPSSRVGISPTAQATAPPSCWSAIGLRPHVRPSAVSTVGASTDEALCSDTEKNAWNAMVAKSTTSRIG
jgi:hypothetical protein